LLGVYDRTDADIAAEVMERVIAGDFVLNPADFEVTGDNGIVTVDGSVELTALRRRTPPAPREHAGAARIYGAEVDAARGIHPLSRSAIAWCTGWSARFPASYRIPLAFSAHHLDCLLPTAKGQPKPGPSAVDRPQSSRMRQRCASRKPVTIGVARSIPAEAAI